MQQTSPIGKIVYRKISSILLLFCLSVFIVLSLWFHHKLNHSQKYRYLSHITMDELRQSSDDLTRSVRTYVITNDPWYEQMYWDVLAIRNGQKARPMRYENVYWDFATSTREKPRFDGQKISLLDMMRDLDFTPEELAKLAKAEMRSNNLVETETIAMHAVKGEFLDDQGKFTSKGEPDYEYARRILFGHSYHKDKAGIMTPIDECFVLVNTRTEANVNRAMVCTGIFTSLVFVTIILLLWLWKIELNRLKITKMQITELAKFPSECPNPVLRISKDGKVLYSNEASKLLPCEWKFEIGKTASQKWRNLIAEAFVSEQNIEKEEESHGRVFSLIIAPIKEAGYVNLYANNITERKRIQRELQESEEKYRGLVESSSDWIWEVNAKGIYTYASWRIKDVMGFSPEDIIGKSPFDFMPLKEAKRVKGIFGALVAQAKPIIALENSNIHKDGREVVLETNGVPILDGDGNVVGYRGMDRDITERKEAEKNLRESEDKYRTIFETSKDAIMIVSQERVFVDANPATVTLFGCKDIDEFISLSPADVSPKYQPDGILSSVKSQEMMDIAVNHGSHFFEWKHKRIDGEEFFASVHLAKMVLHGQEVLMATVRDINERKLAEQALLESEATLKKGQQLGHFGNWEWDIKTGQVKWSDEIYRMLGYASERFPPDINTVLAASLPEDRSLLGKLKKKAITVSEGSYEHRFNRADGSLLVLESSYEGQYDEKGNLVRIIGVAHDITERKRAEQEREELEGQLRQAQKLEAIGTLAGGIAHDFNNILTLIIGYTDLTLQETKAGSTESNNLEQVLIASKRARNLINQILAFSRKTKLKQVPIEITPIVEEVLDMLRSSIPSSVVIKQKLETKKCVIKANATQIHQVLINLCTNAVHAIGVNNGTLEVSLSPVQLKSPLATKFGSLLAGSYVKLTVSDNGCGIESDAIDRIFEPFFTTKNAGKGTGMGLSVVHGIIESHKGLITVDSEKGRGTKFEVYLPRIKRKALGDNDVAEMVDGSSQMILLVDDEISIVQVMTGILRRLNYRVAGFSDVQKALKTFRYAPYQFDLVITDYAMPNMTGLDLAKKLAAIRSDIPIVLYTGFSGSIDTEQAYKSGITKIISKPIDIKKISVVVDNILRKGK